MCEPLDSPEKTDEKTTDAGYDHPATLEKLDIGRGESSSGVGSHARWFEDENPYSKGLAERPPSPSQWPWREA